MTYAYDLQGNRTGRTDTQTSAVVTCVYDAENQLIEASTPTTAVGAFKVQFTYDGKNRLRKRKDFTAVGSIWNAGNETLYTYDGMKVIQERNQYNIPTVAYTWGMDLSGTLNGAAGIGGLLARDSSYYNVDGNWYAHDYPHYDGNGNVTALASYSKQIDAIYVYDPFGRVTLQSGTMATANKYRFSSKI